MDRRALRVALIAAYPWLTATDVGPQAVEAGECERCARRPRVVSTCGPIAWTALCPDCARELGDDAWCDGHRAEGQAALAWAAALPAEWETVVRLWWVATGETQADGAWLAAARADVARPVATLLP